jgi:hypothetical protein
MNELLSLRQMSDLAESVHFGRIDDAITKRNRTGNQATREFSATTVQNRNNPILNARA